ncbi:FAD-dependent oxidoreductase [Clostridium tarantellae]|uniref:FAD-binding protein n=1 Tax=Clostridium tarantellae TaxID=39493 RepID=A0A6I1MSC9_9CLOT|nr:FAD-binding oxidoreductase [Clostridium tarantellae]MPQ43169.1 FAD-binding protein [Clostridium tarantellae]
MKNSCYKSKEIIKPGNSNYNRARQVWNRAIQKYPLAIAYCKNIGDVKECILWCRKNDIQFRIRSKGHSFEGYSVEDNLLTIDLSKMKYIKLDSTKNTITIQSGVTLGEIYNFLSPKGYPFPGGTCPSVGATVFSLGGGFGFSTRYLSLGCDSIEEIKLIDYKGRLITANRNSNSDLFWACKGSGGGHFGIVVCTTYKLFNKVNKVTLISLNYPTGSKNQQLAFFDTWQKWLLTADNRITFNIGIENSLKDGISIFGGGLFYGTPEEAKIIIKPLYDLAKENMKFEHLNLLDAHSKITSLYPKCRSFKFTGRFVYEPFAVDELRNILGFITSDPPKGSTYTSVSFSGLGGKVMDFDKNTSSFAYRCAKFILGIQSVWNDNKCKPGDASIKEANVNWIKDKFNYLYDLTNGCYVNFADNEISNYEKEFFDGNLSKLKKIKRKYDPLNVFKFPQSIKP